MRLAESLVLQFVYTAIQDYIENMEIEETRAFLCLEEVLLDLKDINKAVHISIKVKDRETK